MGCIYGYGNEGKCNMFNEDDVEHRPNGYSEDGFCMTEGDPDPSWCEYYESDSTCFDCGADYNQDEHCTCDEE